ncbi:P-loop NTPase family protein [Mycobacteroides abscessus]|uniref:hypothetical protein n=1 Tax=Mycobacteroides abscessus TaxID=36809 RepID=UPI000468B02B|nr:hypothetical protein [Mycobacteroides abscessus]
MKCLTLLNGGGGDASTANSPCIYHLSSVLHPDLKVGWVAADTMVDGFTSHRDEAAWSTEQKKKGYALSDVLVIDDIQEFAYEDKDEVRSALLDASSGCFVATGRW